MTVEERAILGYQNYLKSENQRGIQAVERRLGLVDANEERLARLMRDHAEVVLASDDNSTVVRRIDVPDIGTDDILTVAAEEDIRSGSLNYVILRSGEVITGTDSLEESAEDVLGANSPEEQNRALRALQGGVDELEHTVQILALMDVPQNPANRLTESR